MRILVCGGRDFTDKALLFKTLDDIVPREEDENGNWMPMDVTIIHGGARGADQLADDWAIVNWCGIIVVKADWDRWGAAAGPIRNQKMLLHAPDIVVAFPGGRGTADMVERAEKAGVLVIKV